jgi:farnesyl diphosphate synthase
MVARAFGRDGDEILDVACVPELVHAASLALDDLPCMDDASVRRGEPTLHMLFGDAVAILAAFALLSRAQALLPRALIAAGVPPAHRRDLQRRFAEVVEALCRGQASDLETVGDGVTLDALERIHAQKTGALFEYAALLGGVTSGVTGRTLESVLAYARNLGLAFQVSDDILDARGRGDLMGKAPGRDEALGRTTFVSVFGVAGAESLCDDLVEAARRALDPVGSSACWLAELATYVRDRVA